MDLDDLDIYEDLDTFQQDEEKKTAELLSLEAKYNDSLKTIETLQLENEDLKKQIRRIGINFQNLLDTAKSEIKRKDKQIDQLRKEKDDICFRRKQPRREYTEVPNASQNTNTWFKNETVLPTANTTENTPITTKNIEAIDNELPSAKSYNTRGRENTHITDDYKKQERRNESLERKYDCDPQREKYNRSNNQREQHVSRYNARSTDRDGNVRSATRDYSHSHASRTAERGHNVKNRNFKNETENGSYNSIENDRRQHSYDRLGDRSRYHSKEEKTKYDSYDGRHDRRSDSKDARTKSDSSDAPRDRRSDSKDTRTKSESSDVRHDRRSDSKRHHEDANKKSKETNEKVMNINRDETVTYTKNSDGLTQSKDIRGKPPNPSKDGRREDKLSENPKFSERTHEDTKNMEISQGGDFLDKHLPACKDSLSREKLLAEQKVTKEKLIALENEFSCKETDKNANRLLSTDGMTTPKKTTLFDELFGNTPTNVGDVNSNVIDFAKGSSSSATTSPSNYTDTSEPTIISSSLNSKKTDPNEYYIPIKEEQNKQNTNDASLVANNVNGGVVGEKLISNFTSKNSAANQNSAEKSVTCVKTNEETVDYAKIATILLSEGDEETETEQAAETHEDETLKNETKSNGNKINGGLQILSNIRLPNIYEIRAHQRRLRELAAAKKAKRAKLAETNIIKQNAAQNVTKVVVSVSELVTKGLQKNLTTTTTVAKNNEAVDLEEESIEAKIQRDNKVPHKNSPQLSAEISADTNAITLNNETTTEVSSLDTTKIADLQSIENLKLVDKNVTPPLEANTDATNKDKSVANDDVLKADTLKQIKSDALDIKRQNETEESIRSNNTEKSEQVLIETESINVIDTTKTTENVEQMATAKTILNNAISDALETVELTVEKAVVQNETKSTHTSIKTDITSAVSPATNINNKKNESGGLSLRPTTVTPNNDNDSERKKSIGESIENIKETQELDESNNGISQTNKASENIAGIALVEDESAQLKACGENTNHLLQNGPMNIEEKESCKQNVIAQQKEFTEVKEIDEQKVGITDEENMQATEKLLEAVNTANETTIEVKVASENAESNCDSVLGEENTEENNRKTHEDNTEQKPIARSDVAAQKVVAESAEYTSEELLNSTDTKNESFSEIENGLTKSSKVPAATNPIMNETKRSADCNRNVERSGAVIDKSESTEPNGIPAESAFAESTTENGSAPVIEKSESTKRNGISEEVSITENTAESGGGPVIEKSESTKHNGISEEFSIAEITTESGSGPVIEKSEFTKHKGVTEETAIAEGSTALDENALRETEAAVSYLLNNMDKPTNSFIDGNEKITEVQKIPNIETKSAVESKVVEKQPKAADNQRNKNPKSKAKELPNTVDNSPERNVLIENMKRSEILWKFKIPKISSKRKREESVDGSSAKESKNAGTDVVKKEKIFIKTEEPIIPYKKKKNDKLIPKQMQQETKMLEINGNIDKNLLETKTLFENQKKSERIIKEIDNWARRKVGETTEIFETENQIEYTQAHKISSTNKHETVKKTHSKDEIHTIQKTDEHNAHIDKNSESTTNDAKSVTAKQRDHNKPPTEERSTRERSCEKRVQTQLLKGQNTKIQERHKSQPKIEHDEHSQGTKPRNGKHDVDIHKEKSQKSDEMAIKCGQRIVTKAQRGELKTLKVEISVKANNTVKNTLGSHEFEEKSKNSSDRNLQNENAVKKALESSKFSTTEHITSKSQVAIATVSCEMINVKCDNSKESADDLNQKKVSNKNYSVAKKKSTEQELNEEEADNHIKRAKTDKGGGKKENVQKLTEKVVTTIEEMQVASDSHIEITNDNQRVVTAFNQTPKRRKTSASTDDSEVMSKSQRRKRFKMRIEDSDDDEEYATHSPPTAVPEPTESQVDVARKNKDIIDILQNDRANESNENLPAPQTPTSLPMNVSQDAEYEEIDSRLQLMFASPKIADKTSSSNSLAVASKLKTQLLQSNLQDSAVVAAVTGTVSPKIAGKMSSTDQLIFPNPIKQLILEDRAVAMGPTSSKSPNKAPSEHPAVANPIKSQLMQPNLDDCAVVTDVTDTEAPIGSKSQLTEPILDHHAVVRELTATEAPIGIDLPIIERPAFDAKPPADFNVTDSFLSDIGANSFLATDMNVTIDETNHTNTSLSDSSLSTKHISLGSSDYRFEKVSENVVNLFITRKRRGKRKPTATITTNTVSAT